jgi:hypothetical protein
MDALENCHGPAVLKVLTALEQLRAGGPPPTFHVPRQLDLPFPAAASLAGARVYRRPDSGIVELTLPGTRLNTLAGLRQRIEGLIREFAQQDKRVIPQGPLWLTLERTGRLQTAVQTEGETVPVIGPGGHVAVYDTADGLQMDIVTRRRSQAIPSKWRDSASVADELFRGFEIDGWEIRAEELKTDFGYFELSKYEQQTILRPAVMAILDVVADESGIPYRFVSVAAVTESPQLANHEGLGNWHRYGGQL